MPVRTYDPRSVVVTFGGVIVTGFADGEFLTVSRTSDLFTKVSGADGVVSRAKSNDFSGEAAITLAQTSPSNDALQAIANLDELSNTGIRQFQVKDLSGRSTYVSAFAWIRKVPDSTFGKEITDREWMLDLADFTAFVGGNLEAA